MHALTTVKRQAVTSVGEEVEDLEPLHLGGWACQPVQQLRKPPRRASECSPRGLSSPRPGPEENENVRRSISLTAETREQPQRPATDKEMHRMWTIHITEHHSAMKVMKCRHVLENTPCSETAQARKTTGYTAHHSKCPEHANVQ